jgi:hypothetical protein
LFAAEVSRADEVRISREHDAWAFLPAREAAPRFLWEAQRRALADIRRQVLRGGPLAAALELTPPPRRAAGREAASRSSVRPAPRTRVRRRRPQPA